MRKILGIFLTAVALGGLFFYFVLKQANFRPTKDSSKEKEKERPKIEANPQGSDINQPSRFEAKVEERKTIFIPDWQLGQFESLEVSQSQLNQYQRLIYFGSQKGLEKFTVLARSFQNGKREVWFTLKITQLPDEKNQFLVQNAVEIVKNYNLQGVALDLEINGLPTDDLVKQINNFVEDFRNRLRVENFKLAVVLYGDTFYRKRPYDVKFLSKNADEVMVMAYDFHKSRGEPGPNFPFDKNTNKYKSEMNSRGYNYSFKEMIQDFLAVVPKEKLTIIFGMYGYNWQVDEKKRPISQAKALTLKEIKKKFIVEPSLQRPRKDGAIACRLENCLIKQDEASKEMEINYVISSAQPDEEGIYRLEYHIVWFESEASVKIKSDFLKKKGIGSVAFWAWGYF